MSRVQTAWLGLAIERPWLALSGVNSLSSMTWLRLRKQPSGLMGPPFSDSKAFSWSTLYGWSLQLADSHDY